MRMPFGRLGTTSRTAPSNCATVGLEHFCPRGESEASWLLLDGFADGYSARIQLTRGEIEALPAMLLRRRLVTLLHWAGRWRVGLATEHDVGERLEPTVPTDESWQRCPLKKKGCPKASSLVEFSPITQRENSSARSECSYPRSCDSARLSPGAAQLE